MCLDKLEVKKLKINTETIEVLINNQKVVVVELGKLKSKSIMNTWLQHLQACAYGNHPRNTILLSRSSSYTKQDQYELSLEFKSVPKEDSLTILDTIYSLVDQGRIQCWPIPPESGWEIAKAIFSKKNLGHEEFKRTWVGSYRREGERSKPEMTISFGNNAETNIFLQSEVFKECLINLYEPLFKNLTKG